MNNKYVIYTGIFGGYDNLIEPQVELHEDIHLVCFTNNPELTSKKWKVIMIGDDNISDHMLNRKVKVLPHLFLQDYEYSLYVDGNIFLKNNFLNFFERYCKGEFLMALPRHLDRYCIYDEAKICILQKKDNVSLINKQMDFYQSQGYPKNNGLYENNILLRKHNDDLIRKIMENWWEQLNTWSKRDQLSLCYVFWNHKFTPQILIESSRISNKYFDIELHSNYKKMPLLKRMFVLIDMKKHKNFIFKASFYLISAIRKIRGWI